MKYGVFSDIHGNLEAFQAVLTFLKDEVDEFIFLGDAVGYGADPNEVIALLKEVNSLCIAGNHDWACVGKFDDSYFNPVAYEALVWTKKNLDPSAISFLYGLPLLYEQENFVCVHGSLYEPHNFHYIMNDYAAQASFSLLKKRICFIGHTHSQEVYALRQNEITMIRDVSLTIDDQCQYIVNVGSIGQPRDRDWRASLCIFDETKGNLLFKRVEYDVKKTADKIIAAGVPSFLAQRLYGGY
jgi:putative phosphoesterase